MVDQEYYVGEVRIFAGKEAPAGWHICDGSLLEISAYKMLYTRIKTLYGGDGITNFALPDLRGRVPIGQGKGTCLSTRNLGECGGAENVTITMQEMPGHTHTIYATTAGGTTNIPGNDVVWANSGTVKAYASVNNTLTDDMAGEACSLVGDDQPHNNMMPSVAINFIISLYGDL